jgi:Zn-dependent metalloprotease
VPAAGPEMGDRGLPRAYGALRCIVPPIILEQIARRGSDAQRERARRALTIDAAHRAQRIVTRPSPAGQAVADSPQRTVSTAGGTETLPGTRVRGEGEPPSGDVAVDEAYDGLGATHAFYLDAYDRRSIDDAGLPLPATVHYGVDYDNAFWDGTQMVFGDGDGDLFNRFTIAVDVIGHELTHGVTEIEAALVYQDQSGALNESVSDVFGSLVKQHALGQSADQADWLVGVGLFTAKVHGVALRSMRAPGTAYDDPVLGVDPQPAHLRDYVETTEDNGGVHSNSGIPNHAFYLAATALGGRAWEVAGKCWYDALRDPALPASADFATFAAATVRAAQAGFGADQAGAIGDAWAAVGVDVRSTG